MDIHAIGAVIEFKCGLVDPLRIWAYEVIVGTEECSQGVVIVL